VIESPTGNNQRKMKMETLTYIKTDSRGIVSMTYFNVYDQEVITRDFICNIDGGYVYEVTDGMHKQICGQLAYRGSTLLSESREVLITVILREYRAMRKEEERLNAFGT
jgi:hypothetical protein